MPSSTIASSSDLIDTQLTVASANERFIQPFGCRHTDAKMCLLFPFYAVISFTSVTLKVMLRQ